ncbi:MAG: spore coat protein U domain-containing protein [Beijerinckiaceae bacterium]
MKISFAAKPLRNLCAALALCLWSAPADAQVCGISVSDLVFPETASVSMGLLESAATAIVRCSGIPYGFRVRACIAMFDEANEGAAMRVRQLRSVRGGSAAFALYSDPQFSAYWGSNVADVPAITVRRVEAEALAHIYGRLDVTGRSAFSGQYRRKVRGAMSWTLYPRSQQAPDCSSTDTNRTPFRFEVSAAISQRCSAVSHSAASASGGAASAHVRIACSEKIPFSTNVHAPGEKASRPAGLAGDNVTVCGMLARKVGAGTGAACRIGRTVGASIFEIAF